MRSRVTVSALMCWMLIASTANAQESIADPSLRRAQDAYDALDFDRVILDAQRSLRQGQLTRAEQIVAHELLGYAYGALDSARQAVGHFRELIFLDPDREPDATRVSPRITSLYASALGQVLVVRRLRVEDATFVANQGVVDIQFELSRPARAIARVVGPGYDVVIDSQLVARTGRFEWGVVGPDGDPAQPGEYQVIVTAVEAGNEFATPITLRVSHSPVDTLDHLTSLPGYTELPETERPPRDWRPLGVAVLYAGLSGGAAVALENTDLGLSNREILGVGAAALVTGFIMSIKRPEPVPVAANIRYNELLRENLARRNAQIAQENAERRRQTLITVVSLEANP